MSTLIENINSTFQMLGVNTVTTIELPPVILNLQILDCRSIRPIKNTEVRDLIINDIYYIENKVAQNKLLKLIAGYKPGSVTDLLIADNVLKSDQNGIVRIPIDLINFYKGITIQIRFEKFAILAETYSSNKAQCALRPYKGEGFKVVWDNSITASPDFNSEKSLFSSWGWKVNSFKTNYPGKKDTEDATQYFKLKKGNTAVDSEKALYFKTSEKFIVKSPPITHVHPNYIFSNEPKHPYPYSKNDQDNWMKWINENFCRFINFSFYPGRSFCSETQIHFVVFGLQVTPPTWYPINESDFSALMLIRGVHQSNNEPETITEEKYGGMLIPTRATDHYPTYSENGRDYGIYHMSGDMHPRGYGSSHHHQGIDYHGVENVTPVFAAFYGKLQSHNGTSTHGKGMGYNKCQVIKTVKKVGENNVERWHVITYAHLPEVLTINLDLGIARPGQIISRVGQTMKINAQGQMTTHGFPVHLHFQYNSWGQNQDNGFDGPSRSGNEEEPWTLVDELLDSDHAQANRIIADNSGYRLFPCDTTETQNSARNCAYRLATRAMADDMGIAKNCWAAKNGNCPFFESFLEEIFKRQA